MLSRQDGSSQQKEESRDSNKLRTSASCLEVILHALP